MSPMTLSPDLIRAEVAQFWNAFSSKDAARLEEFYAHESVGFGSVSTRSEPGRLAATRRKREYFANSGVIRTQVSLIDVVMLSEHAGIACYTFQFHAMRTSSAGNQDEHITNGRATQVFGFDPDGNIRIYHEHFSLPAGS